MAKTTRREFVLTTLGGVTAAAAMIGCGADGMTGGEEADAAAGGGQCTVYPDETEGPYYLDLAMVRRDITEGKAGTPLALVLKVVSAGACTPLQGIAVDVWHCDSAGVYSGYPGQLGGVDTTGQTFLRGTQI